MHYSYAENFHNIILSDSCPQRLYACHNNLLFKKKKERENKSTS